MSIGERAVLAIREMAKKRNVCVDNECTRLGMSRKNLSDWQKRGLCPSAHFLQQMALAGYDVIWILTGGSNENK
jgi:hypothetical protein